MDPWTPLNLAISEDRSSGETPRKCGASSYGCAACLWSDVSIQHRLGSTADVGTFIWEYPHGADSRNRNYRISARHVVPALNTGITNALCSHRSLTPSVWHARLKLVRGEIEVGTCRTRMSGKPCGRRSVPTCRDFLCGCICHRYCYKRQKNHLPFVANKVMFVLLHHSGLMLGA